MQSFFLRLRWQDGVILALQNCVAVIFCNSYIHWKIREWSFADKIPLLINCIRVISVAVGTGSLPVRIHCAERRRCIRAKCNNSC